MFSNKEFVYEVYKERSFSKAAENLFISQPALSNIIKKKEQELNVILFDRSTNPISLTPAGEYFIDAINRVDEIERQTQEFFKSLNKNKLNNINIGTSAFFCVYVLPHIINEFTDFHTDLKITLLEANAEDLIKCLDTGLTDFNICVDEMDKKNYSSIIWHRENIVLCVPKKLKINEKLVDYRYSFEEIKDGKHLSENSRAVNLSEFSNEPFIFLKKGNDLYNRAMKMCKNAGFYPNIVMNLDQLLISYQAARQGSGIVFIRDTIAKYEDENEDTWFYKINDNSTVRNIYLYWKKSNHLSENKRDLIKYFEEK